jgi:hypothetical protein
MNERVRSYFKCTKRERAVFEAGIKLGGIFHQYMGLPVNSQNVEKIEKGIEAAVGIQPFVNDVKVKIEPDCLREGDFTLDYSSLGPKMLNVIVEVKYENILVIGRLRYIEELEYPLMYVEDIIEEPLDNKEDCEGD